MLEQQGERAFVVVNVNFGEDPSMPDALRIVSESLLRKRPVWLTVRGGGPGAVDLVAGASCQKRVPCSL